MTSDPFAWLDESLDDLERESLRRQLSLREGPQTALITWNGQQLVNFASNDYLGLAADPLITAAIAEAGRHGWGAGASPLVCGRSEEHAQLEKALAEFEQTEAALLFPTGFAANLGVIAALVGADDVVFSDEHNHASIIDGCRLSRARVVVYPHKDAAALAELILSSPPWRRGLIVTDSLFSMHGDLAPLPELVQLAEQHSLGLLVDEAHATGVLGAQGRGACELLGVEHGVHVRVGTLSKSLGSMGGFVAGRRSLIDWLANRARPYVFSTAAPPPTTCAARKALQVVSEQPERRLLLLEQAAALRDRLREQGWDVDQSPSQIIPLRIGNPEQALHLSSQLRQQGLLVPCIRPPSVPEGGSLLRISLTCRHTTEMIDRLVTSLTRPAALTSPLSPSGGEGAVR